MSVTCRRNLEGDRQNQREIVKLLLQAGSTVRFDGAGIMRSLYSREMLAVGAHPTYQLFLSGIKKGRRDPRQSSPKTYFAVFHHWNPCQSGAAAWHSITQTCRREACCPPVKRFDLRLHPLPLLSTEGKSARLRTIIIECRLLPTITTEACRYRSRFSICR